MKTLILCLAGPLHGWNVNASSFDPIEHWPGRGSIFGLLAAADGREREADMSDLQELRVGVRGDWPGEPLRDFSTSRRRDTTGRVITMLDPREYLQDAVFLAAIEGPADLIEHLGERVAAPVYHLSLGRRECVPSRPPLVGVTDASMVEVLQEHPRFPGGGVAVPTRPAVIVRDVVEGDDLGDAVWIHDGLGPGPRPPTGRLRSRSRRRQVMIDDPGAPDFMALHG